jgi:acetyl coenzyme A synthetase (ADP forming)-like protein
MKRFFEPTSVVIIGANRERGKIGSEILHNILAAGYRGDVHVVHPTAEQIDGIRTHRSVDTLPDAIDLAIVAVPAPSVQSVVDACLAKSIRAFVIISAGFAETGQAGRDREAALVDTIRRAGARLIGPNCMGLFNADPAVRLHATFSPVAPLSGRVAMSTQSGALGLAVLDYAKKLHLGFSTFASIGNKADVSSNDLVEYWASDPHTDVILLYLESFGNPRKFGQIARSVARHKPIVAVKAGRSTVGARAAASHTGALASSDAMVDALFEQSGVIRTRTLEDLFDVATVVANQPLPAGQRVAIVTNAGGPGILAADACAAEGLDLPALLRSTTDALRSFLPAAAALGNPVDILASATADAFGRALDAVLADTNIDSVIVIFIPPMVTKGEDVAAAIRAVADRHRTKPIVAVFISSAPTPPMLSPIPSFTFPETATKALGYVSRYAAWRRQPEGRIPILANINEAGIRAVVARVMTEGGGWADQDAVARLLDAIGIARADGRCVTSLAGAAEAAERLGYPVALKALGPTIIHKTERQAVHLDLRDENDVAAAWHALKTTLGDSMTGGLVQEMVSGGVEILVGMAEDSTFGPAIGCALGGTLTEVLGDSQFRLHPLTDRDAHEIVAQLRGASILKGVRGARASNVPSLEEAILRLSALVSLAPEIRDLDINPLVVLPSGVKAVDARVRFGSIASGPPDRRGTG